MSNQGSNLVTIKCDNHHERLVGRLYDFLLSNHGVDFDLRWGERMVRAHRLILDLFLSPEELVETAVGNRDCSPDAFLEFLYNGSVTVPEEQLGNLMEVARKSNFSMLVDALEQRPLSGKSDGIPDCGSNLFEEQIIDGTVIRCVTPDEERRSDTDINSEENGSQKKRSSELSTEIGILMDVDSEEEENVDDDLDETWEDSSGEDQYVSDCDASSFAMVTYKEPKSDESNVDKQSPLDSREDDHYPATRSVKSSSKPGVSGLLLMSDSFLACPDCNYMTHQQKLMLAHRSSNCNPKPPDKPKPPVPTLAKSTGSSVVEGSPVTKTKKVPVPAKTSEINQTFTTYQCTHCPYKTLEKLLFDVHQATHDSSIKVSMCQWCSKRMVVPGKLSCYNCKHLRHCPHCDFTCRDLVPYQVHLARHDPNAVIYRCKWCDKPYANEAALGRHRCKQSVLGMEKLKCPHCPFTNKFKHQMRYHIEGMHSGTKPYKCEEPGCNYAASLKCSLRTHVQIAHLDHKPFVCETCGYRTHRQSILAIHQRVHTGERSFKCNECDRTFRSCSSLKEHKERHAGMTRSHVCHLCGSAFYRRDTLRTHLKNVHKDAAAVATTSS